MTAEPPPQSAPLTSAGDTALAVDPVAPAPASTPGRGLSALSLVLGLLGLVMDLWGIVPVAALTFGVLGLRTGAGRGMALTGIVLGVAGVVVVLFYVVVLAIAENAA